MAYEGPNDSSVLQDSCNAHPHAPLEEERDVSMRDPQTETEAEAEAGASRDNIISQTEVANTIDKQDLVVGSTSNAEEEEEEEEHHVAKKLKTSGEGEGDGSIELGIKQVAEVVLVLSGMGQMRAGRPPTEVERQVMAKARHQLGYLAGKLLLPRDLVSREGVEKMIEDLGLNKLKDNSPTVAGPIKSIAERASETMKKLEQARLSTANAAMVSTSLAKAGHGPVSVTTDRTLVALTVQGTQAGPGKHSVSIPQSLPVAQPFIPVIPVIARPPVAQSVPTETRTPISTTAAVVPHAMIALTASVTPQAQASLTAPVAALAPMLGAEDQAETRPLVVGLPATAMLSSLPEAQSISAQMSGQVLKPLAVPGMISEKKAAHLLAETAVAVGRDHSKGSMLSPSKISPLVPSSSSANFVKDVDLPVQAPRKVEANRDLKELCTTSVQFEQKGIKDVSIPPASLNLKKMQIPPQGPKLAESLAIRANHTDIAQNVQKILQSRPPDFRQWEPPSKAYMNAPITCQVCKISVTDVDTILVCDSCEKGVHLKCLQACNQRGIPKGEWHCPKCLIASNGRPLPPKYGRVGKSSVVRRTPVITNKSSFQSSPVKIETTHSKSPQHTVKSNGLNTTPEIPIHVDLSHTNNRHMLQVTADTRGDKPKYGMLSAQSIKEEKDMLNEPLKQELSGEPSNGVTDLSGTPSENENQPSPKDSVSQFPNQQFAHTPTSEFNSHVGSKGSQVKQQSNINFHVVKQPQTLSNSQGADRLRMQQAVNTSGNIPENTSLQRLPVELKGMPSSQFYAGEQTSNVIRGNICQEGEDAQQRMLHKTSIFDTKLADDGTDQSRATEEDDAYRVEWVGDKLHVLGGKTYYQSCCVKGVLYKLHDYALFRPETPNIPPYIAKLQVLWEDDDTGSKWVRVNWCYYPNDIPQVVSRPTTPEKDEVYESNHGDNNLVGSIQGPCEVLSSEKYREEIEKRRSLLKGGDEIGAFHPVFLCKWIYDAQKGVFHPVIH